MLEYTMPEKQGTITIQELYPDLDPNEQREAEENLRRYIEVIYRIYLRSQAGRSHE
jgi:hypothetical protein